MFGISFSLECNKIFHCQDILKENNVKKSCVQREEYILFYFRKNKKKSTSIKFFVLYFDTFAALL